MENEQEVKLVFNNSVKGLSKLEEYETRLQNLKKIINTFPKNFNIGSNDYTQQLNKTNTLLLHLNKNLLNTKGLFNNVFGVERNNETKRFVNMLSGLNENTKISANSFDTLGKKIGFAFNYTSLRTFIRGLKSLTQTMSNLISKASDYGEDINLFQVAFDYTYNSAERFINKLNEMYGLDEDWLTRTVGIFKQLSNAMSLSTEEGTKLSQLMTQMSLDIASLYNLDINRGSSVLQSALAGQTKPIRGATGADITQATLQQTLNELGIDKAITNLSYAEKRLVIIISLTRQLQASVGDMGKTIEQPANQMRILNEQWTRLSRAVGNLFLPLLKTVLPYLNAILMVLTEIINIVASLFGYNIHDFDAVAGVTDSVLELEDGLESASESAEKLKRGLRSFDKLNNITTPTSGSGTSGVGGGGGIDPNIMKQFNKAYDEYFKKLNDVQMKATKIRDAIMEWLGFTKQIDEVTGDVSFKFDHITYGTIIAGALGLAGIVGSLVKIFSWLSKIGHLLGIGGGASAGGASATSILGTLGIASIIIVGILGGIKNIDTRLKMMRDESYIPSDLENFILLGETGFTKKLAGLLNFLSPLKQTLTLFDKTITKDTKEKVESLYDNVMLFEESLQKINFADKIITDEDVSTIQKRLKTITKSIINELDSDKNQSLKNLNTLQPLLSEQMYSDLLGKVEKYYNDRKSKVEENEKQILDIINKANEEHRSLEAGEIQTITELRQQILDDGLNAMSKTDEEYAKLRMRINENINANQLKQASQYIKTAKETKDNAIKEAQEQYEGIVLEAQKLKEANIISEEEYNAMVEGAKKTRDETIQKANEQYQGILDITKEKLGENAKYIDEETGNIKTGWDIFWEDVEKTFDKGWKEIKKWWDENISKYFTKEYWKQIGIDIINGFIQGIRNTPLIREIEKYFDFSTMKVKTPHLTWKENGTQATGTLKSILEALSLPTSLPKLSVSWYAKGGLPEAGQLFVANERGAELVGNIGGQSFVANQNQIVDLLDRKLSDVNAGIQNATFIVQVGSEKICQVVLNDLQNIAKSNGKPITIGV